MIILIITSTTNLVDFQLHPEKLPTFRGNYSSNPGSVLVQRIASVSSFLSNITLWPDVYACISKSISISIYLYIYIHTYIYICSGMDENITMIAGMNIHGNNTGHSIHIDLWFKNRMYIPSKSHSRICSHDVMISPLSLWGFPLGTPVHAWFISSKIPI